MEHVSIGIINILRKGLDAGYWTVEQIDRPSSGWQKNTRVDRSFFKNGYQGIQHRNLLRDSQLPQPDDLPF